MSIPSAFCRNGSAIIASPDLHVLLTGGAFSNTEIFYNKVLTTTNGIGLYSRDYDTGDEKHRLRLQSCAQARFGKRQPN